MTTEQRVFRSCIASIVCAGAVALPVPVDAQTYPTKPIRFVIPFAPGGPTDILGRAVGQKLNEAFGVSVIIDNRGGAGGNIGAEIVARSLPDGYTLLMGATSTHAINPALYRSIGFDPEKDFAPVTLVSNTPSLLAVHPALPLHTVKDVVAYAKARPGQLSYASAGNGSSNHLAGVLLCKMAKIEMTHIPYKGSGPALVDVIAGQVPMMFNNTASILPHVRGGRLRAIALTSAQRSTLVPEIPTFAESGLPGFDVRSWHGVFVPAGTPQAIVGRLNEAIVRGLRQADVRDKLAAQGVELVGNTSDEFALFVRGERVKWAELVKQSGARAD